MNPAYQWEDKNQVSIDELLDSHFTKSDLEVITGTEKEIARRGKKQEPEEES